MRERLKVGDQVICTSSPFRPVSPVGYEHPMVGQFAVVSDVVSGDDFDLFTCARWPGWWCSNWFLVVGRDDLASFFAAMEQSWVSAGLVQRQRPTFNEAYWTYLRRCKQIGQAVGLRWVD